MKTRKNNSIQTLLLSGMSYFLVFIGLVHFFFSFHPPHCYFAVTCRKSTDISFLAFRSFFLKDYAITLQVASNGQGIAMVQMFPKHTR